MGKLTVVILAWLLQCSIGANHEGCDSPQYLEYGKSGVIYCSLIGNFTAVFWYGSTNIVADEPIITLINSVKDGYGFESGKFDITSDGSLIITEVDRGHGKNFTMAKFTFLDQKPTIFVVSVVVTGLIPDGCESPQYLEYGQAGVVHCHFQTGFHSVLWYNSTDTLFDAPIVTYSQSGKSGRGFESREFDIFSNGSLLVHKVGLVHEHEYTVIKFASLDEDPSYFVVHLIVTVKSLPGIPVVNKCQSVNTTCYIELDRSSAINCTVYRVRPPVSVKWLVRTRYGDRNISSNVNSINNNVTFTSWAVTSFALAFSSVLNLLVCRAHFVPGVLQTYESVVLVQDKDRNLSSVTPIVKYAELNSTLQLKCTANKFSFLVWKRSSPFDNHYENFPPVVYIKNHFVSEHQNHLMLGENGSLIVPRIHPQQDGFYGCIYGDGITDGMTKYKIVTYVKPVPGYPVIEECNYQQYCTLEVQRKGNLTCVMRGVLPKVELEWKTPNESLTKIITFYDKNYEVIKSGETFNIKLTSSYNVATATRVSVECRVSGPGSDIFPIKSVVDLRFYHAEQKDDSGVPKTHRPVWIWMFVLIPLLSLGVLTYYLLVIIRKKRFRKASPEEGNALMHRNITYTSPDEDMTVKREVFINQLRKNFKDLYTASPPPFYVDVRMEEVVWTGHRNDHLKGEFCHYSEANNGYSESEKVDSYTEIVNKFKSALLILEGKPGVGKSTVACQILYDWLNREQDSNLKHNEILIFLQLRRLGGIKRFYQAVHKVALSHDFPITESEIEVILGRSPSVTVILDGYDEYPNKGKDEENVVTEVIELETLKNAQVILTTRIPFFPRRCAHQVRQITLSGFDNKAQDEYLRKAEAGKDDDAQSIKRFFSENSISNELGRIPLIFVKFAHMYHNLKKTEKQKLSSVTNFFRLVMSCFNSHMINKTIQEEEDNEKYFLYNFFEKEHEELNKIAFKALTYRNQQTKWEKEKLLEELTSDLYDQCVRTGILVEEKISSVTDIPNCSKTDRLKDATMVKFYHNMFCEWFAAHHLASHVARLSSEPCSYSTGLGISYCYEDLGKDFHGSICSKHVQSFLEKVDPFKLQYTFRFACGLNRDSAENIIKCLNRKRQTKLFAILCTLEKEGEVKGIAESLRKLCSTDIFIRNTDSQLQQRTIIQLLEIASESMVPIVKIWLANSFRAVETSKKVFHLKSNFRLPVLSTLKELEIRENGREFTEKEFGDISKYLSSCPMLEEVVFNRCLLPQSIEPDSLCHLQSNQIQVFWSPFVKFYRLNLVSGQWQILDMYGEIISSQITDEQYQELEEKIRSYSRGSKAANHPSRTN